MGQQPLHELSQMEHKSRQAKKLKKFQENESKKPLVRVQVCKAPATWIMTTDPAGAVARWEKIRARQLKELEFSHFKPAKPLNAEQKEKMRIANKKKTANKRTVIA